METSVVISDVHFTTALSRESVSEQFFSFLIQPQNEMGHGGRYADLLDDIATDEQKAKVEGMVKCPGAPGVGAQAMMSACC